MQRGGRIFGSPVHRLGSRIAIAIPVKDHAQVHRFPHALESAGQGGYALLLPLRSR